MLEIYELGFIKMIPKEKILYTISSSLFFVGIGIAMSWSYYTPRLLGLFLVLISMLISYKVYKDSHMIIAADYKVNPAQILLGILLIIIDIIYNIIFSNKFGFFDRGLILTGVAIISINLIGSKILKIDEKMIKFTTYFIFIAILTYSTIYVGMEKIFGTSGDDNPFYTFFTSLVVKITYPILNLIQPTTVYNNTINFNGFSVGIAYACSGVESLAVFFSAITAFYFTQTKKNNKKFIKYLLIGSLALYIMNIIRVITLILIGSNFGVDRMMFFHANLGWIMFVIGMAVFWYLVFDDF